jgi:hypothetical protein
MVAKQLYLAGSIMQIALYVADLKDVIVRLSHIQVNTIVAHVGRTSEHGDGSFILNTNPRRPGSKYSVQWHQNLKSHMTKNF